MYIQHEKIRRFSLIFLLISVGLTFIAISKGIILLLSFAVFFVSLSILLDAFHLYLILRPRESVIQLARGILLLFIFFTLLMHLLKRF